MTTVVGGPGNNTITAQPGDTLIFGNTSGTITDDEHGGNNTIYGNGVDNIMIFGNANQIDGATDPGYGGQNMIFVGTPSGGNGPVDTQSTLYGNAEILGPNGHWQCLNQSAANCGRGWRQLSPRRSWHGFHRLRQRISDVRHWERRP